ncbi:hypothetical protein ACFY93_24280 [Streptomyces sp. NPDC008313]|uniref:hypothetical protein n=1 Tax=Streptomyces sp. NPDC008313 TaxID=3364826 RepID=UPI0036EB69B7
MATLALLMTTAAVSCGARSPDRRIPSSLCGTPVDEDLSRPLFQSPGEITEWNRVDRAAAGSSWCVLLVGKREALSFKFAWHGGSMDPLAAASPDNSVTGLQNAHRIDLADDAVLADDGAIATTHCKTSGGDHFTLAIKLHQGVKNRPERKDIERFMRAYMPATVKTLGCG